jgi:hypothetical protein
MDPYVRAIGVREYLDERRSSWIRRVTLTSQLCDRPAGGTDPEASLDMQTALAGLPPRQRAAGLVPRQGDHTAVDVLAGCAARRRDKRELDISDNWSRAGDRRPQVVVA